jgi:hypothetical protein
MPSSRLLFPHLVQSAQIYENVIDGQFLKVMCSFTHLIILLVANWPTLCGWRPLECEPLRRRLEFQFSRVHNLDKVPHKGDLSLMTRIIFILRMRCKWTQMPRFLWAAISLMHFECYTDSFRRDTKQKEIIKLAILLCQHVCRWWPDLRKRTNLLLKGTSLKGVSHSLMPVATYDNQTYIMY